ncbi:MAG: Na+/H+ antiporter subunit E [Lachnospiraceae bacterium]|nr:Na+/H+ antiporter subunit E [Lachnospiraceae bacterium]
MLVLFFVLWVIFNGRLTVEIAAFGVVVAVLLFCFVCRFMDYSLKKELRVYRNILRGASYLLLLLVEIFKANYSVIRLIVSPKYEIEPKLIKFKVDLKSDTLRAVLADSITLTPGTITVMLKENEYLVHCLDKDMAVGMEDLEFVRRLEEFERGGKGEDNGTGL